jgi:DNA-binding transcriptional MerR regulator
MMGGFGIMKYTIGMMSELLGVTQHMLRYYEKIGIIKPETNEETGYRYYSVIDTRRFNLCRMLFTAGIPLEQCAEILNGMPQDDLERLAEQKIAENKRQIEKIKISNQFLETAKETYAGLECKVGAMYFEYFPRMWRLNLSQNETPYKDKQLKAEREQWLDCLPAVFWTSRIPRKVLKQFSEGSIDYEYGLMCSEPHALALGLKRSSNVEIVPGGDFLVTLHRKVDRDEYKWSDIKAATDYLQDNGITFFGDAFSNIVASRVEDGKVANYHRLIIKIYT